MIQTTMITFRLFSIIQILVVFVVARTQLEPLNISNDSTTMMTFGFDTSVFEDDAFVKRRMEPKFCPSNHLTNTHTNNNITDDSEKYNENKNKCGLYVAVSTIPNAGLGTFTGIDRKPGDVLGPGDIMVPLYDVSYHLQALGKEMSQRDDVDYLNPTRDYVWYGCDLGMQYETSMPYDHISGISYGLNTIINCHLALVNAIKSYASYDFANLHRSIDPGIGAFTPYHNASTRAKYHMAAGSELFKSYGDHWFIDRTETLGLLPLTNDYKIVETMAKKLQHIFEDGEIPTDIRYDFYEQFILRNPFMNTSRALLAMPKVYDDIQYLVQNGSREYYQRSAIRSVEYLKQQGRCVDTIQPKRSTLRQAGRGAFATRSFQKDATVIGTPFLFHASDDFFKLYDGNWITKDDKDFNPDLHVGYQLMYNYCWRHEHHKTVSSIVLCPYGMNVNYINHNQSRANVRVQWAQDGEMNHNTSLLNSHPQEMYYSDAPRLWLDFVALRDIEIGEEIFMDYGNVWEEAWQRHVAKWNKDNYYPTDYVSAYDWNKMNAKAMLRTAAEQVDDPYPDHFTMMCLPEIANPKYTELWSSAVCERTWNPSVLGFSCYIIDREQQSDGSYWYQVKYRNDTDVTAWAESDWIVREAIKFVNKPYTNDLFLEDAFRQPIGIPDEIFPGTWRGIHLTPLQMREIKPRRKK